MRLAQGPSAENRRGPNGPRSNPARTWSSRSQPRWKNSPRPHCTEIKRGSYLGPLGSVRHIDRREPSRNIEECLNEMDAPEASGRECEVVSYLIEFILDHGSTDNSRGAESRQS